MLPLGIHTVWHSTTPWCIPCEHDVANTMFTLREAGSAVNTEEKQQTLKYAETHRYDFRAKQQKRNQDDLLHGDKEKNESNPRRQSCGRLIFLECASRLGAEHFSTQGNATDLPPKISRLVPLHAAFGKSAWHFNRISIPFIITDRKIINFSSGFPSFFVTRMY